MLNETIEFGAPAKKCGWFSPDKEGFHKVFYIWALAFFTKTYRKLYKV
jgi:hypothetical protein